MPDKVSSGIFKFDENVACTTQFHLKNLLQKMETIKVIKIKTLLWTTLSFFSN